MRYGDIPVLHWELYKAPEDAKRALTEKFSLPMAKFLALFQELHFGSMRESISSKMPMFWALFIYLPNLPTSNSLKPSLFVSLPLNRGMAGRKRLFFDWSLPVDDLVLIYWEGDYLRIGADNAHNYQRYFESPSFSDHSILEITGREPVRPDWKVPENKWYMNMSKKYPLIYENFR